VVLGDVADGLVGGFDSDDLAGLALAPDEESDDDDSLDFDPDDDAEDDPDDESADDPEDAPARESVR